ncbi:hypothetical protein Tco_1556965 [Tanacetum coccineum]
MYSVQAPSGGVTNSSIDAPNPNSFNDPPNVFTYPPQPQYESYSCELCGNDAHYGYDCPLRVPLVYEHETGYDNYYQQNSSSFPQQYLCCENYGGLHEKMSIQDMELQKQQYLEEMQSISNQIRIKDYRNERIDIHYRRECEIKIDELKAKFNKMSIEINKITKEKELRQRDQEKAMPLSEIISQHPSSIIITTSPTILPIEDPEDSLIMGNEELSTILEKESDELINSSVEDLVPIPNESKDTSGSDSECNLPSCDDFSPINTPEGKSVTFSNPLFDLNKDFTSSDDESLSDKDVPEDKVKIYSNPLFKFDDIYISSDVNSLFDEVL